MRLSVLAQPVRELSKDKAPFNLGAEHQQTFTQMKKEIASAPVLAYYSPKKQTMLQTDACIKVLVHVCCKKNLYILQVKLLQMTRKVMWP